MRYSSFLRVFLIGLGLLLASHAADAQSYEDGLVAFDRAEYPRAAGIWEPLAAAGDAKAQHALGMLYESGQGVPAQDFARAAELYRASANQGETAAMNNLALMYADGRGVTKDVGEAYRLWTVAAKAGHPQAQFNLALLFFRGQGIPEPDFNEAAWWFAEAANNGSVDAQFALGELYARGMGVPQSNDEARRWYTIAAGSGHGLAQRRLDDMDAASDDAAGTSETPTGSTETTAGSTETPPIVSDEGTESAADEEVEILVVEPTEEPAVEPEPEPEPEIVAEPEPAVAEPEATTEPLASSEWADPNAEPAEEDATAATDASTKEGTDEGATQESALPDIPPPSDEAQATDEIPGGVFVLLGRAETPVQAEQAWSILKVAFPNELGPVSPRMVQSADGKYLIFGGPLASMADADALCARLRQRAESIQCQSVTN